MSAVALPRSSTLARAATVGGIACALLATGGMAAYASADFHGNPYAAYQLAIGASSASVGAFVGRRRPDHPLGFLLLCAGAGSLLTFSGSSFLDWWFQSRTEPGVLGRVVVHSATWGWILTRYVLAGLAPLVYPGGWPKGHWSRFLWWAGVATTAVTVVAHSRLFTPEYFAGQPAVGTARLAEDVLPWGHRGASAVAIAALATMCVRVARLDRSDRHRHLPFAVALLVLTAPIADSLYSEAFGVDGFLNHDDRLELWAMIVLPVVLAGGIFFGRALDIEVVLRRTTTYLALASFAVVIYVAVVWVFSLFVQEGSGAGPVVATGVIAAGVLPAHATVERLAARMLFGDRANPYGVIAAVGNRLELAPSPAGALQSAVETLGEQLRLPFVAIELTAGDTTAVAAQWGVAGSAVDRFPLVFQGEPLGELVVGRRTEREPFRSSERDLLATFAGQCGVVAHDAALTAALRRSRSVLLHAREAERLRIRRDLHDGLGPTLATVSLSLATAAERLQHEPALAALLCDLEAEIQDAIADIRRLVYDLRPPALDDVGLVEAIRGEAARLGSHSDGLVLDVSDSGSGTVVPPPVELAAYRIAVEAMTNTARHAHAGWCRVSIDQDRNLVVRVEDDGGGIAADAPRGVGLRSMQERVTELGGWLRIEPRLPRGTVVVAAFPLEGL